MNKQSMNIYGIVNILSNEGISVGTGFFANTNGYILTCYHVLKDIQQPFILQNVNFKFADLTQIHKARIGSFDPVKDIAILYSDYKSSCFYPLIAPHLDFNDPFSTMGFPKGQKENLFSYPTYMGLIECNTRFQLGNANEIVEGFSGAPLLNSKNQAIGMITGYTKEDNGRMIFLASAIPSFVILDAFRELVQKEDRKLTNFEHDVVTGITAYRQFVKGKTDSIEFKGIESLIGANVNTKTLKLYAPLYIKNFHGISDTETTLQEIVSAERGIIIKGDPGSGKSTFIKYVVRNELEKRSNLLPFIISLESFGRFIENSDLTNKQKAADITIDYILYEYPQKGFNFTREMLEEHFFQGESWFLFDGFDEIDSIIAKQKVLCLIDYIFDYWSKCKFVVTSRPYALDDYNYLKDFQKVYIDVLHKEQMELYINNLAEIVNFNQYLIDANGLINKIRDNLSIHELARTPVMLTFICVIYFTKDEIPENRFEIFEKIIAWLIKTKFRSELDQDRAIKKYASIAKEMFEGAISPKKEIESDVLYSNFGEEQTKRDFLHSINEVGIMVKKNGGNGSNEKYIFWHFCFEAYLTAKSLCEYEPVNYEFLLKHWFNKEWQEVIVLFSACLLSSSIIKMSCFVEAISEFLLSLDLEASVKGASLLGTIFKEIYPNIEFLACVNSWNRLKKRLQVVFTDGLPDIPIQDKCNAAIAYGLSGDERIQDFNQTFINIPGGHFFIGAQNRRHCGRKFDLKATVFECPIKEIYLDSFEIRKYPITVEEFEKFVQNDGYLLSKEIWTEDGFFWREDKKAQYPRNWRRQIHLRNSPVTGISWYEAVAYCNWLTANANGRYLYKLPSESQWEYSYIKCFNVEQLGEHLFNCYVDYEDIQTKTPIGIFPTSTSSNGLTDMLGNVEEWCEDSWHTSLSKCPIDGLACNNPQEIGAVTRGGSTIRTKRLCRYTYRARCNKYTQYDTIGFRIVRQERV